MIKTQNLAELNNPKQKCMLSDNNTSRMCCIHYMGVFFFKNNETTQNILQFYRKIKINHSTYLVTDPLEKSMEFY